MAGEGKRLAIEVHSRLQSDLLACDALLSLLVSAAASIRHDSLVKPFPPSVPSTADGQRDISRLVYTSLSLAAISIPLSLPSPEVSSEVSTKSRPSSPVTGHYCSFLSLSPPLPPQSSATSLDHIPQALLPALHDSCRGIYSTFNSVHPQFWERSAFYNILFSCMLVQEVHTKRNKNLVLALWGCYVP